MIYKIDIDGLPDRFPTHRHGAEFWEQLGRAVATFGFLEETLGKAIFVLTSTRRYPEDQINDAYQRWIPTLRKALYDPLGRLIETYGKEIKDHPESKTENIDEILEEMRKGSRIRNALCHGSWSSPDQDGKSVPFFVTPSMEIFGQAVDVDFLIQVQTATAELACAVVESVTDMGWRFPGSRGPGESIF